METKQVNISCRHYFDEEEIHAWMSDYTEDGYAGRLIDTVYADDTPSDYTDWCVFAGTEGECLIFRGLYNIYGEKIAFDYKERLQEEAYKRFLKRISTCN